MEIFENPDAPKVLTLAMLDEILMKAKGLKPLREEDLTPEDWHKIFNGLAILEEHLVLPP